MNEEKVMNFMPRIEQVVEQHSLGAIFDVKLATEFPTIGSDGLFAVTSSNGKFILKFINNPDKLLERAEYHRFMQNFLPLPKMLGNGKDYMALEFIQGPTLLQEVIQGSDVIQSYFEALLRLCDLWKKRINIVSFNKLSRNYIEAQRAEKPLMEFLDKAGNCSVVINGKDSGLNIRQVFDKTLVELSKRRTPYLIHGDARLENVIVNSEKGPVFIDLSPGIDWIDDLVLFGWHRDFRLIEFLEPPEVRNDHHYLEISFMLKPLVFADAAEELALRIAKEFGAVRDLEWRRRYHYTIAAVGLAHPVFVQYRRKINALGRALPENAEYFWIAEAIRHFKLAQEC